MVTAHLDGDVLVYEIGFAAESYWRAKHAEKGIEVEEPVPFEVVQDMMEKRTAYILAQCEADKGVLYLTGKKNFRNHIAKTKPYKERPGNRPLHYKNIRATFPTILECVEEEGLEADDLIALNIGNGVAASRDKDIRQVPGTHYSWSVGVQPEIGPHKTDEFGFIELRKKKIFGYGDKFLYAQILMGDSVDSIPGCPNYGPVTAMKMLENATNVEECLNAIIPAYQKCYQLEWKTVLREQARLVHLIRRFENGKALLWDFPGAEETWIDVKTGGLFPTSEDQGDSS